MAVSDFKKSGLTRKQSVKILTVDTANRRLEATLKDGGKINIAVWETPPAFRWPVVGEVWTVWQNNGQWMLDGRVRQSLGETHPLSNVAEGEMQLDADVIVDASGHNVVAVGGTPSNGQVPVWNQSEQAWTTGSVATGGDKNYVHNQAVPAAVWTVTHNLGKSPSVTVVDSASTEVEGAVQHIDANSLTITFASAFGGKAYIN